MDPQNDHHEQNRLFPTRGHHASSEDGALVVRSRRVGDVLDPDKWPYRCVMLALIGIIKIFLFYFGDVPASLEDNLISLLAIDTTRYGVINAVYQGSNLVGCVIGGLLLDRLVGVRWGIFLFSVVMAIAQSLFAVGVMLKLYWLVLVAQVVLGASAQVVEVASAALVGQLFLGKELNFAFAILSSLDRLGGVIAFNTDVQLYDDFHASSSSSISLASVLFLGSGYAVVMAVCSFVIIFLDTWTKKKVKKKEDGGQKWFQRSDLKQIFSLSLWLISLAGSVFYMAFFGLSYNGRIYFERKFGLDARQANFANSVLYIVPAVICPFIGLAIDLIGCNLYWSIFGMLFSIGSSVILMMGSSSFALYMALVISGLSYAMTDSSIFPMVVLVVKKSMLASAYSIIEGILAVGFVLNSLILGLIADSRGYLALQVYLTAIQFLAFGLGILLYFVDSTRRHKLTRPGMGLIRICKTQKNIENIFAN